MTLSSGSIICKDNSQNLRKHFTYVLFLLLWFSKGLFVTPWSVACQACLSFIISWSLLNFMSIESMMLSNHLFLCLPFAFSLSQFSHSVMSNSLWTHEVQHARPPCPSPTPGVYSNSCPLSRWCDAIQPSHPVSSPSPPALNHSQHQSFPMSQLLASGGQSIGVWASTSVLPMNTQDWSPLGWTGWICLLPKGLSRVFSNTIIQASILWCSAFFIVQLSHPYMTTGKTIALTRWSFLEKVMSLLFNMLSRLVITSLPRSKHLLISWLQSPSAVILEPQKIKSATVSTVSPSICCEVMGPDAMILVFWMLSFKPTFSLSSFTFIKRHFSSFSLSAIRVVSSAYLRLLIFLLAILIPDCASSSPAFLTMYSAYKLNKQGDNVQPWHTPFPIWNQSVVPFPVLNVFPDLHTDFSRGRSGGLGFSSLEEFSTVYCDPHSQRLWHSQ